MTQIKTPSEAIITSQNSENQNENEHRITLCSGAVISLVVSRILPASILEFTINLLKMKQVQIKT